MERCENKLLTYYLICIRHNTIMPLQGQLFEADADNPYTAFLGPGHGSPYVVGSWDEPNIEMKYEGVNLTLQERFVNDVKTADRNETVEKILPFLKTDHKKYKWVRCRTDRKELGGGAYRAPPEVLPIHVDKNGKTTEYITAAIYTEFNFYETDVGRRSFQAQYTQVVASFAETVYSRMQRAFAESYNIYADKHHSEDHAPAVLSSYLRHRRDSWGILNLYENGLATAAAKIKYEMFSEPDTWLLPPCTSQLLSAGSSPVDVLKSISGIDVIELRQPTHLKAEGECRFFRKRQSIGHYTLMNSIPSDAEKYKTSMQDVAMNDMNYDGQFAALSLAEALRNLPYWGGDHTRDWFSEHAERSLQALVAKEKTHWICKGIDQKSKYALHAHDTKLPPHVLTCYDESGELRYIKYLGEIHPAFVSLKEWVLCSKSFKGSALHAKRIGTRYAERVYLEQSAVLSYNIEQLGSSETNTYVTEDHATGSIEALRSLLLLEFTKENILILVEQNCRLPFKPIIIRPNQTYITGSPLLLKRGSELGCTPYNEERVMHEIHAADRMMTTSMALNTCCVIHNEDNFAYLENGMVDEYVSGDDMVFADVESYVDSLTHNSPHGSIIVDVVPMGTARVAEPAKVITDPIDILGYVHVQQTHTGLAKGAECSFPGSILLAEMWRTFLLMPQMTTERKTFMDDDIMFNTTCFQDNVCMRDDKSGQFDRQIPSTGYWRGPAHDNVFKWRTGACRRDQCPVLDLKTLYVN